ncbi:MAG: hypothetical protein ABSE45_08885 [Candidatus Acidiferrales bacterium]
MALFESPLEHPPSKFRRYTIRIAAVIVTIAVFVAVFPAYLWYPFVYYSETKTVDHLMVAIATGNMQRAYEIWQPSPSYSFKDFLDDWGPDGYYGPVRSFRIGRPEHVKNGSATDIAVDVSPYQPYPDVDDVKSSKTKTVHLWVNFKDKSITFPPY